MLQGFFVFIFFVVLNNEARDLWKSALYNILHLQKPGESATSKLQLSSTSSKPSTNKTSSNIYLETKFTKKYLQDTTKTCSIDDDNSGIESTANLYVETNLISKELLSEDTTKTSSIIEESNYSVIPPSESVELSTKSNTDDHQYESIDGSKLMGTPNKLAIPQPCVERRFTARNTNQVEKVTIHFGGSDDDETDF